MSVSGLYDELVGLLGPRGVSVDRRVREKASLDGAKMSPIIVELLPLGMADIVAFPTSAEQIAEVVAAAVRHEVAITPRGKGTGNYGQAIPMPGGLVLDMSRARAVVEVGDGVITAEAGAPMVVLEQAAREAGQELWMYPSTAQSSIGGFLAGGSGGTGSIEHGSNSQGFVAALDVVHAVPDATLVHVEGDDAQPYVHNYGTAGIIARATVRLDPVRDWHGFYASFDTYGAALEIIRAVGQLDPIPRLVSADLAEIANALPEDPAIPADRASLRAILDVSTLDAATALVESVGGRVEEVRPGPQACVKISTLSYNHPIEWLQKTSPGTYFHLEVGGDALVDRIDAVHAVYPGGMLHIEAQYGRPIGMLAGIYESPEQVYAGIEVLKGLGVGVHSPHQWFVDFEVERTLALAATTDPRGLLNPGKLGRDLVAPGAGEDHVSGRKLAELSGTAVAETLTADSVIIVPTGAVEHHGPHLPLITDALLAEALATAAVAAGVQAGLDLWLLPTLTYTKSDEHAWAPGTVWLRWSTLMETLIDLGRSVAATPATKIVFMNGHGGNTALLQVANRELRRQFGLATFTMPAGIQRAGAHPDADEHGLGIHAGHGETSLVLHVRPDLVDLSLAERNVPEHIAGYEYLGFNATPVSFGWTSDDFGPSGVIGDPTKATAEAGAALFAESVERSVAALHEIAAFRHQPPTTA